MCEQVHVEAGPLWMLHGMSVVENPIPSESEERQERQQIDAFIQRVLTVEVRPENR